MIHVIVLCLLSLGVWAQQSGDETLSEAERASNRGAGFAADGDFRRAASAFRKAIGLDPTFTVAHYNLGLALLRQEDYEDAVHAFSIIRGIWLRRFGQDEGKMAQIWDPSGPTPIV